MPAKRQRGSSLPRRKFLEVSAACRPAAGSLDIREIEYVAA